MAPSEIPKRLLRLALHVALATWLGGCANDASSPFAKSASGASGAAGAAGSQAGASGSAGMAGAAGSGNPVGGSAGSAGGAGAAGSAGAGAAAGGGSSGSAGSGAGMPYVEPDGPTEVRVANSSSDLPKVWFCYRTSAGFVSTAPWPAGGLNGGSWQTAPTELAAASETQSLEVWLLTSAPAGDCATEIAKGHPVARSLGALPEKSLARPRALLLAIGGCFGDPYVKNPFQSCGVGVDPSAGGNLQLVFAELSRLATTQGVGVQVVNASPPLGPFAIRVKPDMAGNQWNLAPEITVGAIKPRPPVVYAASTLFGPVAGNAEVSVFPIQGGNPLVKFTMGDAMNKAGLDPTSLVNGTNWVWVVSGSRDPMAAGAPDQPAHLMVMQAPKLPPTPLALGPWPYAAWADRGSRPYRISRQD